MVFSTCYWANYT